MARRTALALLALIGLLLALSCAGRDGVDASPAAGQRVSGKITVFAAASLSEPFKGIAAGFEAEYPGATVDFNFGGTPTLRAQLEQGARADVFASADLTQMDLAFKAAVVEATGRIFTRNSLVIITPRENPAGLQTPADLGRPGLKLVLAAPEVPVGGYSRRVLSNLEGDASLGTGFSERVLKNVVSNESNVKQVVAKVQLGEADAGIVYGSDVTASVSSSLHVIDFPQRYNVTAEYPIALVKGSGNRRAAAAFIEYVLSAAGQRILQEHGFAELT